MTLESQKRHLEKQIYRRQADIARACEAYSNIINHEWFEYALKFSELKESRQIKEKERTRVDLDSKRKIELDDKSFHKAIIHHLFDLREEICYFQNYLEELENYSDWHTFMLRSNWRARFRRDLCKSIKGFAKYDIENKGAVIFKNKLYYDIFIQEHYDCSNCVACEEVRNNRHKFEN